MSNSQSTIVRCGNQAPTVWVHSGHPAVPIRWVLVRDPLGKFKTQALLCTDLQAQPSQIVA